MARLPLNTQLQAHSPPLAGVLMHNVCSPSALEWRNHYPHLILKEYLLAEALLELAIQFLLCSNILQHLSRNSSPQDRYMSTVSPKKHLSFASCYNINLCTISPSSTNRNTQLHICLEKSKESDWLLSRCTLIMYIVVSFQFVSANKVNYMTLKKYPRYIHLCHVGTHHKHRTQTSRDKRVYFALI